MKTNKQTNKICCYTKDFCIHLCWTTNWQKRKEKCVLLCLQSVLPLQELYEHDSYVTFASGRWEQKPCFLILSCYFFVLFCFAFVLGRSVYSSDKIWIRNISIQTFITFKTHKRVGGFWEESPKNVLART